MTTFRNWWYRTDQRSPGSINLKVSLADDTNQFRIVGRNPGNAEVSSGTFVGLYAWGKRERSKNGLHCRGLWVQWGGQSNAGQSAGDETFVVIFRPTLWQQTKFGDRFNWRGAEGVVIGKYPEIVRV